MKRVMLILAVSAFAAEASVTLDGTVLKADVAGGVEETYSVIGSDVTGLIKTGSVTGRGLPCRCGERRTRETAGIGTQRGFSA